MGRESRLRRSPAGPNDWEANGNGRKLFDPDQMPEGCDRDIWHLTLYFAQKCEEYGVFAAKTNGYPVIYTELKKTLENPLTKFNPSDTPPYIRKCGININWLRLLELSINNFFVSYDYDYYSVINDYCSNYDYYVSITIELLERELLNSTGNRVTNQDREIKPSRRTEEEKEATRILNRKYTEEELEQKLREFKEREE